MIVLIILPLRGDGGDVRARLSADQLSMALNICCSASEGFFVRLLVWI